MTLKTMATVPLLLLLVGGISAQCLTGNDYPATQNASAMNSLKEGRLAFSVDMLKKAALMDYQGNIFFSPYSIHQALTLAYFGSRGTTEKSLKEALRIPDVSKVDVQRFYSYENSLKRSAQNAGDYEYKSGNRLWISDEKKLRECMLNFFGDELQHVDFRSNPDAVRVQINDWISNTTAGHIKDLLPPSSIQADADLVLANAVYFKGLWQNRFNPENSKKDIFYTSGLQNSVTTFMWQKKYFNYAVSEELGAHVLELPYKGQDISMFIFLPPFATARTLENAGYPAGDGVRQLLERMSTEKGFNELKDILNFGILDRTEVEVTLPRFEVDKELPLVQLLHAIGAGELVSPNATPDLRGFLANSADTLHLGDAVHRAIIEVTEEGTTAAAATALFSFRSSRPLEPAIFNANHPFVYLIYQRSISTILFAGVFRAPNQPQGTA